MTDFTPDSDTISSTDFLDGPRTVTISKFELTGDKKLPWDIYLAEIPDGRPYKPGKFVGRILEVIWGNPRTVDFVGRRMTLFRDPDVMRGKEKVGGLRLSHASHIDGPTEALVVESRQSRRTVTIQPLPDAEPESPSAEDWEATIRACTDVGELRTMWQVATPEFRELIQDRVKEIEADHE